MSEYRDDNQRENDRISHDDSDDGAEQSQQHDHAPRVARSFSSTPIVENEVSAGQASESSVHVSRPSGGHGAPHARRMSLSLTRIDAWSVAKVSFLLGVAGGIVQIVAAAVLWLLLNVVGLFDQITQLVQSTGLDAGGINLADVFSLTTVLSVVTIFSIIEVVLITLLVTVFALLYNVVSALVGGVHLTLGDD